ncbi:lactoylglutathione lyase [Tremella mesenterica]|uniref:lactoylglutathione lyase n=1 Tax=Tremella mesenterica TaxID=5217 RepID=A0A4Q1BRC3_TREME|nr:lactoylglutathione lyase [Tremella mesenterica]
MFRIKNPEVSLPWYKEVLGMEVIHEGPGNDFTNFFLAHPSGWTLAGKTNPTSEEKSKMKNQREGVLELCWNHGTEKDPNFKGYVSGNEEPSRGFGHICIAVDDLNAACKRFDDLGVKFKKRPEEGRMRNIAFIFDPDGYWVEIVAKQ